MPTPMLMLCRDKTTLTYTPTLNSKLDNNDFTWALASVMMMGSMGRLSASYLSRTMMKWLREMLATRFSAHYYDLTIHSSLTSSSSIGGGGCSCACGGRGA